MYLKASLGLHRLSASFIFPPLALFGVLFALSTEAGPYAVVAGSPGASPRCSVAEAHLLPELRVCRQGELTVAFLRDAQHLMSYTEIL